MTIHASPSSFQVMFPDRDFLTLADYASNELLELLALAAELKRQKKLNQPHTLLQGKSIAMYFEKPSNRTRISFEVGIFDLGAHPIMLKKEEINLGVRESIADTARTLSRYVDGIMIRTFCQHDVEELAKYASIPVINGLTDDHHPCQVLADLLTIQEHLGTFEGRKLTYIGDGNNMAHSLMEGCALVGMDITIACPNGYTPKQTITERAYRIASQTGTSITITDNIQQAVQGASVLYTDVWTSMGEEAEAEIRKQTFKHYQVNEELLTLAEPDVIVLHCLPAHRGEEITHNVLEHYADVIFDQAENRLHAQKAILAALIQ